MRIADVLTAFCPSRPVAVLPLGIGFSAMEPRFPCWALSALPLCVLALVGTWIWLSCVDLVPIRLAPWALSNKTVWLDVRLCHRSVCHVSLVVAGAAADLAPPFESRVYPVRVTMACALRDLQ
jgi:hypothetical protein